MNNIETNEKAHILFAKIYFFTGALGCFVTGFISSFFLVQLTNKISLKDLTLLNPVILLVLFILFSVFLFSVLFPFVSFKRYNSEKFIINIIPEGKIFRLTYIVNILSHSEKIQSVVQASELFIVKPDIQKRTPILYDKTNRYIITHDQMNELEKILPK